MANTEFRPYHRTPGSVEVEQFGRRIILQSAATLFEDDLRRRRIREELAFHVKECKFLITVHKPQVAVELKTVYNRRRIPQTNMFRSEITVSLNDTCLFNPLGEKFRPKSQEVYEGLFGRVQGWP